MSAWLLSPLGVRLKFVELERLAAGAVAAGYPRPEGCRSKTDICAWLRECRDDHWNKTAAAARDAVQSTVAKISREHAASTLRATCVTPLTAAKINRQHARPALRAPGVAPLTASEVNAWLRTLPEVPPA